MLLAPCSSMFTAHRHSTGTRKAAPRARAQASRFLFRQAVCPTERRFLVNLRRMSYNLVPVACSSSKSEVP